MKKKEPWRILVGVLSIIYIIFLWVRKDIASVYGALPPEQLIPVIATYVAVSILKILGITAVVLIGKWLIKKIKTDL